jgi:hypothetical protein
MATTHDLNDLSTMQVISGALLVQARQSRLQAASRVYAGPDYSEARAELRQHARRCELLASYTPQELAGVLKGDTE